MSLRLRPGRPVPDEIRRIVSEQVDRAIEQLRERPEGESRAVHESRKRFKKVRGILRLVKDELDPDSFRCDNACFREAGRLLAGARDAVVLDETIRRLYEDSPHPKAKESLMRLREDIGTDLSDSAGKVDPRAVESVLESLAEAKARIATWELRGQGFEVIRAGLKRSYKRGRERMVEACLEPDAERFHEWRKRVKDLWYQARVVRSVLPGEWAALPKDLHTLSDLLGDLHDLTELRKRVESSTSRREAVLLADLIDAPCRKLESQARVLGERIYQSKPKEFVADLAREFPSCSRELQAAG